MKLRQKEADTPSQNIRGSNVHAIPPVHYGTYQVVLVRLAQVSVADLWWGNCGNSGRRYMELLTGAVPAKPSKYFDATLREGGGSVGGREGPRSSLGCQGHQGRQGRQARQGTLYGHHQAFLPLRST